MRFGCGLLVAALLPAVASAQFAVNTRGLGINRGMQFGPSFGVGTQFLGGRPGTMLVPSSSFSTPFVSSPVLSTVGASQVFLPTVSQPSVVLLPAGGSERTVNVRLRTNVSTQASEDLADSLDKLNQAVEALKATQAKIAQSLNPGKDPEFSVVRAAAAAPSVDRQRDENEVRRRYKTLSNEVKVLVAKAKLTHREETLDALSDAFDSVYAHVAGGGTSDPLKLLGTEIDDELETTPTPAEGKDLSVKLRKLARDRIREGGDRPALDRRLVFLAIANALKANAK